MMMKIIVRGLRSRGCPYRGKRGVAEPTRFEPVRRVLLLQQLRGDRSHRGGGRRRRILVPRRLTHSLPLSLPAARPFLAHLKISCSIDLSCSMILLSSSRRIRRAP
ncbi:uncharacterized protein [Physcomitrium patens]|uniref:uncharacterized protein n=1 Tax=Physcomitrium patens TaxID=3218 RepID=UPI003CCCA109